MSQNPSKIAFWNALVPAVIAFTALIFWLSDYGKKLAGKLNFKIENVQKTYESSFVDGLVSLDLRVGMTYVTILALTILGTIVIANFKLGIKRNGKFIEVINSLFNTCTNLTTFYSLFFSIGVFFSSNSVLNANFLNAFLYIFFGLGAFIFAYLINLLIELERNNFFNYVSSIKNPKKH